MRYSLTMQTKYEKAEAQYAIKFLSQGDLENMSNKVELPKNWACDGKELKPKSGALTTNTWTFNGREIKPKVGAISSNTWVWDGKELKPKANAMSTNTWVIDGKHVKPKAGATSKNTYETGPFSILIIAGQLVLKLW